MKTLTTADRFMTFHGNCKSERIKESLFLTGQKKSVFKAVINSNGIYNPDSINIKRYARAIVKATKDGKRQVLVNSDNI